MADLGAAVQHVTRNRAGRSSLPIANTVTLYEGALLGIEGGYLNHWADGAADVFAGVCLGPSVGIAAAAAMLGNTSATPVPEASFDDSGVTLMHLDSVGGTPTQAKVGDIVYSTSSNTDDMSLTAVTTTDNPIGWMSRWRSATDLDVTLFTPSEFLAYVGT